MHNDEAVTVYTKLPTLWDADADVSSCTSLIRLDWRCHGGLVKVCRECTLGMPVEIYGPELRACWIVVEAGIVHGRHRHLALRTDLCMQKASKAAIACIRTQAAQCQQALVNNAATAFIANACGERSSPATARRLLPVL